MQPNGVQQEYDVVIVGAGPAGCTVAKYLSDRFNILMIDRANFPRDKPCGGLLVEESQHFIKQLEPLDFVFSRPKKLKLRLVDWDNNTDVKVEREYVNVVRNKFDYWLEQLIDNRVTFMDNTELIDFFSRKDGTNIVISNGNKTKVIKANYVVGADGAGSLIWKALHPRKIRTYVAIQETVNYKLNSHAYFIYDHEVTDFYSWAIPKGDRTIVGAALPMVNGDIRAKFALLKKKAKKKLGVDGDYENRESSIILRPESIKDLVLGKDNILLVGEAAGLISPSTGEGISFALRSGKMCAHALNNLKDVEKEYKKLCQPLVDEISDKILKSNALSDVKTRTKVFEQWHAISEPLGHEKAVELWAK